MSAEVEAHHAGTLAELRRDPAHRRSLPGPGEPVRDHDGQVVRAGVVAGVDRHAVSGVAGSTICGTRSVLGSGHRTNLSNDRGRDVGEMLHGAAVRRSTARCARATG